MMEQVFQYKGYVFRRDEHCPTCSSRKAKAINSTATLSFGDKCNHPKQTTIMRYFGEKPTPLMRQASEAEITLMHKEYDI